MAVSPANTPYAPKRPRHKGRQSRTVGILVAIALTLAVAALLLWFFGYEKVYQEAWNTMPPSGRLSLTENPDGTVLLQWPKGAGTDYYTVTVWQGDLPQEPETAQPFFAAQVQDALECTLPALPEDQSLTIRVESFTRYKTLTDYAARPGEYALTAQGTFAPPEIGNITWEADPDADTVTIRYDLAQDQVCQLYVALEGTAHTWQLDLREASTVLHFGPDQTFPMPQHSQQYRISFASRTENDSYHHQGLTYQQFSVTREDLLGTELTLNVEDLGCNLYQLTWNETKGRHYEVQCYDEAGSGWVTLAQIPNDGQRSYSTGHLERYSGYRFRVVAAGDVEVIPDEVTLTTGASLIYSTLWPISDQPVYTDPQRSAQLGTAPKGTAFCILDQENGLFRIRLGDAQGWIDSNYCMINLPEFLGDICSYDITNSYASLFMVHGYEISGITGTTVTGYEYAALSETDYLVPLLYPAALKLEKAAFAAMAKGYRLKIYDSYRPGIASQTVRDATEAILTLPLPESPYVHPEQLQKDPDYLPVIADMPVVPEDHVLTYNELMTDFGRYSINYFIAAYGSRHNQGVALDLTLEDSQTGQELPMQCDIHDLSHYAERKKNLANANLLSDIMQAAGFGTLVSEWWHFQDNDAIQDLDPDHLWGGITPQCWMADDTGWRYRTASGTYLTGCTKTIDGTEYTFDAAGYLTEASG